MTSGRPRALMLCHRIPYPPDKGDKIRSWRLLSYLAARYDVSLGCFVDDEDDWRHTDKVASVCADTCFRPLRPAAAAMRSARALLSGEAITMRRYRDRVLADWVRAELAKGPVVAVGFSAAVMDYLTDCDVPVIADLCDADSAKWTAYGKAARGPKALIFTREGRILASAEAAITRQAARTFLVTPEEAALVRDLAGADAGKVDYYRNGVDTDYFAPGATDPAAGGADIVLTGAMDYRPNADGADWFVRSVLPILRDARPQTSLAVVGARPTKSVLRLGALPGITVTGRVADVRPWIEAASVAIAPLSVARGVQNKVLEAMAMGKPVVASPAAARGTQAIPGEHLLAAETPNDTAAAILSLLGDKALAARIGAAARSLTVGRFGWDAALSRLGEALPPGLAD